MTTHATSARTARSGARRRSLALLAALALAATLLVNPAMAGAEEVVDDCAYGYTSDANVFFGSGRAATSVPNYDVGNGCTIMDEIMAKGPYTNQISFLTNVAVVTLKQRLSGPLNTVESLQIVAAAAKSDVGKTMRAGDREAPLETIGTVLFTVRDQMEEDPLETLETLAECGVTIAEPSGGGRAYHGLNAEEMANVADQAGVEVASIGVSLDDLRNDVEGVIADAHEMGADYARFSGPSEWDLDDYVAAAEELNEIGQNLAEGDVKLAYHNHGWEFDELASGVTGYDILVRGTDPDYVAMELDTYWAESVGQSVVDLIREYPGRFEMLHLKDVQYDDEGEPTFADVGEGVIDFPEIFAYAGMGNVQWHFIEHDQPQPDGTTSVCNSWSNLTQMTY